MSRLCAVLAQDNRHESFWIALLPMPSPPQPPPPRPRPPHGRPPNASAPSRGNASVPSRGNDDRGSVSSWQQPWQAKDVLILSWNLGCPEPTSSMGKGREAFQEHLEESMVHIRSMNPDMLLLQECNHHWAQVTQRLMKSGSENYHFEWNYKKAILAKDFWVGRGRADDGIWLDERWVRGAFVCVCIRRRVCVSVYMCVCMCVCAPVCASVCVHV